MKRRSTLASRILGKGPNLPRPWETVAAPVPQNLGAWEPAVVSECCELLAVPFHALGFSALGRKVGLTRGLQCCNNRTHVNRRNDHGCMRMNTLAASSRVWGCLDIAPFEYRSSEGLMPAPFLLVAEVPFGHGASEGPKSGTRKRSGAFPPLPRIPVSRWTQGCCLGRQGRQQCLGLHGKLSTPGRPGSVSIQICARGVWNLH